MDAIFCFAPESDTSTQPSVYGLLSSANSVFCFACDVKLLVLSLLLMPYLNRYTGPIVERMLVNMRLPLRITLGILTFLFYEAFTEMMRHHENMQESRSGELLARMEILKLKFRAERNFYLFAFTFAVFIIILRLDVILGNYRAAKTRLTELEAQVGISDTDPITGKPAASKKLE